MSQRLRPDPDEFQRCVNFLCTKIETVALRSGMSDPDCKDLEGTLAAMPPTVRDRVRLMLDGTEIQTEYDDPTMAFAARYLLKLAQSLWDENPHPLTVAPSRPSYLSQSN
jgi:hypothetical protein